VREVVFFAPLSGALEFANPQAAGEALSKMDDARPLIVDSREDREAEVGGVEDLLLDG
jgi:hypothetical protein